MVLGSAQPGPVAETEKWLGSKLGVGGGGHRERRWERPGVGGSEHPRRALHPTQGQEGSQEGGSSVVPAGPAGQWDRRSGKGSCHTADSVCAAGRILGNVRGSGERQEALGLAGE